MAHLPMIEKMGMLPSRGRRAIAPLSLLVAIAAIAPAANAGTLPVLDAVQGTVNSTVNHVQSTVTEAVAPLPQPVQQVVTTTQSTIDQVQSSLGPAQGPAQGPVDGAQATVDRTVGNTGSSGSSNTPSSSPGSSPSNGSSSTGTTGRTPRSSGGSRTAGSGGGRVRGAATPAAAAAAGRAATGAGAGLAPPDAGQGTPGAGTRPSGKPGGGGGGDPVGRTLTKLVKVVPGPIKVIIALLATLAALLGMRSFVHSRRARRLERQREELLDDVGLLQRALLPDVPARIGALETSVGYRPADGPAAGGDFYDVFEIQGGRVAVIVGDVCGHGRQALAQTALIRYTLRAYMDAGLGPRAALQVAGRALANDIAGELTTVVVAVYDPDEAALTYACAGHEPPILLGPAAHEPVVGGAAPPLGAGIETGIRETRVPLPAGATACFFTDGLVEARVNGGLVGRAKLTEMLSELG
ncbi:MAG: PP2C family protein-serine/threonine phosphatase, partial [Thermoleophilaceae bacterium]